MGMVSVGGLPWRNAADLDIEGCRSFKSVESGFRPSSSEISLPVPMISPSGDDQVNSAILAVLALSIKRGEAA